MQEISGEVMIFIKAYRILSLLSVYMAIATVGI